MPAFCAIPLVSYHDYISSDPLSVPSLTVDRVTNSAVNYRVQRNDDTTDAVIIGYEVTRFGVPMIGHYVNAGTGETVTISPAVPGAQYRITAWALTGSYNGRRSATPAVVDATTGEASECYRCKLYIALYNHSIVSSSLYFNVTYSTIEKLANQVSLQKDALFHSS